MEQIINEVSKELDKEKYLTNFGKEPKGSGPRFYHNKALDLAKSVVRRVTERMAQQSQNGDTDIKV